MFKEFTKEIAYVLGFIWADGYIYKFKKVESYKCVIECCREDLETIKHIFLSIENIIWQISYRHRKNRKPQMIILTTDKIFCKYLLENGYSSKSHNSADKILKEIPSIYHVYFLRGLIDGDGCFYIAPNRKHIQFSIASTYEQNWTFVQNFLNLLKIRSSVNKRISSKKHKSSELRVTSKHDIVVLGKYLYSENDGIFLLRKFEKFNEIKELVRKSKGKTMFKKQKSVGKLYISKYIEIEV